MLKRVKTVYVMCNYETDLYKQMCTFKLEILQIFISELHFEWHCDN